MNRSRLVSVIIPVYKTEPYLRKCLDSIVNQTLKDIEIICVNDGSPDNSLSILSEFASKDSRIVIINQPNQGVSVARNAGIAAAKGQYIGFVDSDDWIAPDTYATAVQYMTDDVDLVCWGVNLEGDTEAKKRMYKLFDMDFTGKILTNSSNKFSLPTTIWDKLFRKELINNNHIKFPKSIRYEDHWFLWKYLLHVNSFHYLDSKFYNYVLHEDSFMASKNRNLLFDRIYGFYDVYLYYEKFGAASFYSEFFAWRFYRYFRSIYQSVSSENKNDLLKQAADLAEKMDLNGSVYRRQLFFLRNGEFEKMKTVIRDQPLFINRLYQHIKSCIYFRKCLKNGIPLALAPKAETFDPLVK